VTATATCTRSCWLSGAAVLDPPAVLLHLLAAVLCAGPLLELLLVADVASRKGKTINLHNNNTSLCQTVYDAVNRVAWCAAH